MVYLNHLFLLRCSRDFRFQSDQAVLSVTAEAPAFRHGQIDEILSYINQHLTEELTIAALAENFFISVSYLCRIFKESTGTTINKYITARRITLAKSLLSEGYSVSDTCQRCGFQDYSNFLKAFTKAVGISPKKYSQFSLQG